MTKKRFIELHGQSAWDLLVETIEPPFAWMKKFMPSDDKMSERGHKTVMRLLERLGIVEATGLNEAEQKSCEKDLEIARLEKEIKKLRKQLEQGDRL
ncbi:MAG: hypothetical protein WC668_04295 [Patescibacteria group bacterium]|jgi:hypothetical protein